MTNSAKEIKVSRTYFGHVTEPPFLFLTFCYKWEDFESSLLADVLTLPLRSTIYILASCFLYHINIMHSDEMLAFTEDPKLHNKKSFKCFLHIL